jgi:hypothetical protein
VAAWVRQAGTPWVSAGLTAASGCIDQPRAACRAHTMRSIASGESVPCCAFGARTDAFSGAAAQGAWHEREHVVAGLLHQHAEAWATCFATDRPAAGVIGADGRATDPG